MIHVSPKAVIGYSYGGKLPVTVDDLISRKDGQETCLAADTQEGPKEK